MHCFRTWGGQSGLNLCSELQAAGVLDKYNVKVIGVQVDAIERGEDRIEFKNTMNALGVEMARSDVAYSVDEALLRLRTSWDIRLFCVLHTPWAAPAAVLFIIKKIKDSLRKRSAGEPRGSGSGRRVHSWMGRAGAGSCPRCKKEI